MFLRFVKAWLMVLLGAITLSLIVYVGSVLHSIEPYFVPIYVFFFASLLLAWLISDDSL